MDQSNPSKVNDYKKLGLHIIPCYPGEKRPKYDNWQNDFMPKHFDSKDNIGLPLFNLGDVDVDNPIAKKFLGYIKSQKAVFGRASNPRSHLIYKGDFTHKKFALPPQFNSYTSKFPHGACLIELRAGKGHQTILPGSVIKDEKVEWQIFEGIHEYPGDLYADTAKVALSTALSIIFPASGNRDNYLLTIGCILLNIGFDEDSINEFCTNLRDNNITGVSKTLTRNYGTLAKSKKEKKQRMFGFTKLKEITGVEFSGLFEIFSWVGLERPNEKIYDLIGKYYYLEDTGLMYDPVTQKEYTETIFNNNNLYDFPGQKGKDKAFKSLLKHHEFQEKILLSKQFLPSHDYPVAIVADHALLAPGKYYNLWSGFQTEPTMPDTVYDEDTCKNIDVKELISLFNKHYINILGAEPWNQIKQYISMCLRHPGQKHRWVPLIISGEGVGKGLLLRAISSMMGQKYVNENVSFADITEKHSTIVVGTLFIALNEVSIDGGQYTTKRTISAKIKPFISDDFLNINEKGKPIYKYLNNCNAMIFSNDLSCLHMDTSSRRYYVCVSKKTNKEIEAITSKDIFSKLFMLVERYPDMLMHHFMEDVEIEDEHVYSKRAPRTPDLLNMIDDSKHDLIAELDDALNDKTAPFDDTYFRGFISLNQLLYFIKTQWNTPYPSRKLIKNWLKDNSHEWEPGKQTRQIMMKASRPRVYWLDQSGPRKYLNNLTEGELGKLAEEEYPAEYLEFQKLDYRMHKWDKSYKRTHEPRNKYLDLKRAIPHLVSLDYETLDEVTEIKRQYNVWNNVKDPKDKTTPFMKEHEIFLKTCKHLQKLLKKYAPKKDPY